MLTQYLPITWGQYHALTRKLAISLLSQPQPSHQIVAISRGGLTLGHLLSDFLRIPVSTITIQSYTDIQTQGEIVITARLQSPIRGKRVLLVDDVADSGRTLKRATSYLKKLAPADITAVTMFYKPHSVFRPDIFAKQTKKWILFPYEPTEMIYLITKKMTEAGKTKAQIQRFLERLGYNDNFIAFVRKYHLK
ncbi:MAG: phosphoribosyltransferase [Patescibacteria group bacterium]